MGKPIADETKREIKRLLVTTDLGSGEIAEKVGVSRTTVNRLNREFNIRLQERIKWTTREIDFIKYNHGKLSVEQMAYRLPNRTPKAIQCKLFTLGLSTKKQVIVDFDDLKEPVHVPMTNLTPKIKIDDSFVRRRK
ncbi:hypothetical protein ACEE67_01790 [Streptococcus thoraltensis]